MEAHGTRDHRNSDPHRRARGRTVSAQLPVRSLRWARSTPSARPRRAVPDRRPATGRQRVLRRHDRRRGRPARGPRVQGPAAAGTAVEGAGRAAGVPRTGSSTPALGVALDLRIAADPAASTPVSVALLGRVWGGSVGGVTRAGRGPAQAGARRRTAARHRHARRGRRRGRPAALAVRRGRGRLGGHHQARADRPAVPAGRGRQLLLLRRPLQLVGQRLVSRVLGAGGEPGTGGPVGRGAADDRCRRSSRRRC